MKQSHLRLFGRVLFAMFVLTSVGGAWGITCLEYYGGPVTQNFNTLPVSGTTNLGTVLPAGWGFVEAGTGADTMFAASDGSLSTPNTYSFGIGTNTDRAFGEITGTLQSTIGFCLINLTGSPITQFDVAYTGEQWRLGDPAAPVDKLDFQYSTTAASLNSGVYTDVNELDFSAPNNSSAAGALLGNSAANRAVIGPIAILPTSPLPHGGTLYMRWVPLNAAGSNDGLAIDDFLFHTWTPCNLDLDLDGKIDPLTDGLMLMRAMLGLTGTAVTSGALGATATRTDWNAMAHHLNASCKTNFALTP